MKKHLTIACIAYTAFVIYGSLVPWQFNGLPFDEALRRFQNIQYLTLGVGSRADWVANILLFIPLAFLWTGVLSFQKRLPARIVASGVIVVASLLLCAAIEFTQLFFPPRTVSLNDIYAESLGGIIGVLAWWYFGNPFISWLENWQLRKTEAIPYLQIYLGCMFFYSVMPLDLTLSPVEFYHKWHEGRVILLPFFGLKGDFFRDLYDVLADIALWIPVPWLWSKLGTESKQGLIKKVVYAAATIEFFQLFVYSRVTDVTDILLALIGGAIGVHMMGWAAVNSGFAKNTPDFSSQLALQAKYSLVAYFFWFMIVVSLFWFPYDFEWSYQNLSLWSERFFKVPFLAYYYGTEYRAITEVFHKVLLFIPFGIILRHIRLLVNVRHATWLNLSVMAVTALIVELGQLFLPNKNSDITDVVLEVLGGYIGFLVMGQLRQAKVNNQISGYSDRGLLTDKVAEINRRPAIKKYSNRQENHEASRFGMLLGFGGAIVVFAVLFFASKSQAVPYNVRELFSDNYPALSALGITLLIYWCFAFPLYALFIVLKRGELSGSFYIKYVLIHSLVAWFFVRAIIPVESIHDVLGSPILAVPQELELLFRFLAIFSVYSLMIIGAAHTTLLSVVSRRGFARLFLLGFFWVLVILAIDYWVVVIEAATDNLTELMANGGYSFAVVSLCIYLFLFGWVGSSMSLLTIINTNRRFSWVMALFIISIPLGYQLLNWGTEQFVLKYGAVFSAMQFLLSSDRDNLVSDGVLKLRYLIMHIGFIVIVFIAQLPFFLAHKELLDGKG